MICKRIFSKSQREVVSKGLKLPNPLAKHYVDLPCLSKQSVDPASGAQWNALEVIFHRVGMQGLFFWVRLKFYPPNIQHIPVYPVKCFTYLTGVVNPATDRRDRLP